MWLTVFFDDVSVAFVLELLCLEHSAHFKAKFARGYYLLSVNRQVVAKFPLVAETDIRAHSPVRGAQFP